MANWSKNKILPANVNNGNEFLPTDGVYSGDMNAAFNNAFYAVDYATALADTPDTSEVGNVGTPSVSLIDNVKDGKAYKKFKFANLKGEKGQDGKDGADGAKGADGKNGVDGENGADGEPALAYGAAISLTTDTPSADISLPNLTFNRTPKLNDLFIAVASSSTNSYQVVYKIITEGSPQSTARPQSYVVTTGKQLAGGASLDGNNVFTGNNTFNGRTVFGVAPQSATYESASGTAILQDNGTQIATGQTTRKMLLRGNEPRPKYTTNEESAANTKEVALLEDVTLGRIMGNTPIGNNFVGIYWNGSAFVAQQPTLANASWAEIAQISEAGDAAKYFKIGDEKTITLTTGEEITVQILGFNHDDLTSGGSGAKAGITFGMKNLLATIYPMNSERTNVGGWDTSTMRTSTMQTLLSQLPSDLRSAIKNVYKTSLNGGGSSETTISIDTLFLFARVEVDGTTNTPDNAEGTQYDYWKTHSNQTDRIKALSDGMGSPNYWWFRSTPTSSSEQFRYVNTSGQSSYAYYADSVYGVCFGFCV